MKRLLTLLITFSVIGSVALYGQTGSCQRRGSGQGLGANKYYEGDPATLYDHIKSLSVSEELKTNLISLADKVRSLPRGTKKTESRKHLHKAIKHAEKGDTTKADKEIQRANKILSK
ncbi:MAG: hypothetical protein V1646_02175 [bacterium]